ncbi:MAG TPA: phosphatidylglycerophosphatase A [Terriglobales bacterium]|nr:phosphatidylglycerophosphatase A [Terriglobales bacterium]
MDATSTEPATSKPPLWATTIATFIGTGYGKPGPGTWASVATVLLWAAFAPHVSQHQLLWTAVAVSAFVTLIGIPAATVYSRAVGSGDPCQVVIDEVAGQMIALIGAPLNWKCLVAGLILFRVFDITKPFPLRRFEKLPEGIGIMMDDVGAGLYALAVMQILLYIGFLK